VSAPLAEGAGRGPTRAERAVAWLMRLAQSRGAVPATFLYNLAQSVVLPGPSDTLFLPLAIAEPRRAIPLALTVLTAGTIGSSIAWAVGAGVLGGVAGLGVPPEWLASARTTMEDKGWLFIALSPLTPISSKLMGYGAGAVGMSWASFMLPLTLGRLLRYAVLVPLIRRGFGDELLRAVGIDRAKLAPLTDPTRATPPPAAGARRPPD
jgi:membrane protein YqaA with SNARE-associated domain